MLHVVAAVGKADQLEPVSLVEAARPGVLLEHPELEARRTAPLRVVHQLGADSAALCVRIHVEMLEPPGLETGEPDDAAVLLREPGLLVQLDKPPAEPRTVLVRDPRQVGHPVARVDEDAADGVRVVQRRLSDHRRTLRPCLESATSPSA